MPYSFWSKAFFIGICLFCTMNYFEQESERLRYKRLSKKDIPSWLEFFENNDRLHFFGFDPQKTHSELAESWILKQLDRYQNEGLGLLAIHEKKSDLFIGMAGIIPREVEGKSYFEIAYSLKPNYWGKGYGTEAALQMKSFGLQSGLTKEFISIIHRENVASIKVARKNKMEILFESTFLGMEVFIFGTVKIKS